MTDFKVQFIKSVLIMKNLYVFCSIINFNWICKTLKNFTSNAIELTVKLKTLFALPSKFFKYYLLL